MALLQAKNVTKYFGENCVLNDVSIEIEKGSFVSIIGASGSGKSTLLTILGGIDKPTEGTVLLEDREVSAMSEKELAILRRTKVGFVFQFFNLAPYLTAEENVLLPIMLSGKVTDEHRARAKELMEYLGVIEQKDKLPQKMSGGEQQRIAIARGLIINPEVILLDEPTGNLDSRNSAEIMSLLKRINEEVGTTIVQVTHSDLNATYGDRIITIKDGKIVDVAHSSLDNEIPVSLITETQIDSKEEN
ncbi:MAG: ABC transporter ATP-binding protein [Clostridia bacterium]|nr:ABC transporter ATP-binding protein [Clostridia bacterium]